MKKNQTSIDGFIPRNRTASTGRKFAETDEKTTLGKSVKSQPKTAKRQMDMVRKTKNKNVAAAVASPRASKKSIKKSTNQKDDLDQILQNLDVDETDNNHEVKTTRKDKKLAKKLQKYNKKRFDKGKKPVNLKQFKNRRRFKRGFLILALIVILGGGFVAYKALGNVSRMFGGNILDLVKKDKLVEDSLGRTNILVFGTSPDGWDGQDLTDSIMIVSLNQNTGDAYTISLPRDLWVKHTCVNWLGTTAGKLNESYGCGKADAEAEGKNETEVELAGQKELARAATDVLGLDIHYQVHANWQVLIDAVDSLGGIDVKIEVYDGSPEMYDIATNVRYKDGEIAHMNGERALAFSRARGSAGGYGLSGGNFDREKNQQKILKATVDKVMSSGKNNPVALMGMLEALGTNVRTSFKPSEIQTLAGLSKSFNLENMKSLPLVDEANDIRLMTTGNVSGASVVVPTAGTFSYEDIKAYIAKNTNQDPVLKEEAKLVILNGTEISGLAAEQAVKLGEEGYKVVEFDSAPTLDYSKTVIYKMNDLKSKTVEKLVSRFKTGEAKAAPDSFKKYSAADIVVIMGEDE